MYRSINGLNQCFYHNLGKLHNLNMHRSTDDQNQCFYHNLGKPHSLNTSRSTNGHSQYSFRNQGICYLSYPANIRHYYNHLSKNCNNNYHTNTKLLQPEPHSQHQFHYKYHTFSMNNRILQKLYSIKKNKLIFFMQNSLFLLF